MSIVKKQHYVPRFYLKRFSRNEKLIFCFDKAQKKSFPSNIENIANERYFYDLSAEEEARLGIKQFMEKYFHPVESSTCFILNQLINQLNSSAEFDLESEQINVLSEYLHYQFIRTKEYREFFSSLAKLQIRALAEKHIKFKFPGEIKDNFEVHVDEPLAHAKQILNVNRAKKSAANFRNRYWIVVENTSVFPLYTSDQPVAKVAHKKLPNLSNSGLLSEGVEIVFPISSRYILITLEKTYFSKYSHLHRKKISINSTEHIEFYNWIQIKDSYRQIYCEQDTFDLVSKSIDTAPSFFNIERPRALLNNILQADGSTLMHTQLISENIYSPSVLGEPFFK